MVNNVSTEIEIPHGVVFLYDPTTIIDVPDDTGAGPVQATKNCVTVWTLGEYEGKVTLTLSKESEPSDYKYRMHDGAVETPNNILAFMTSGCEEIIKIRTDKKITIISINSNDDKYPSKIYCRIE
jgi:hypothetical protein